MTRKQLFIGLCLLFLFCLNKAGSQDSDTGKNGALYDRTARTYDSLGIWDETLRYNIMASEAYRKSGQIVDEARTIRRIADKYFIEGIYRKAALYYEQEYSLHKGNKSMLADAGEHAGISYFRLSNDSLSAAWYEAAASDYDGADDKAGLLRCREKLGQLYTNLGLFDKGMSEYEFLLKSYSDENDTENLASIHNQTGFLHFRKNNIEDALAAFNRAIELAENSQKNESVLTDAWSNKAICYQNLENEREMLTSFSRALGYAEKSGRIDEAARIERIMAMIYFRKGDNYHAEVYCQNCIESARASGNTEVLQLCYRDYSEVLEKGNDFIRALEYYEKHLTLRDSLSFAERLNEKNRNDRVADFEEIEQRIRDEISSREIRDLELKTLRAENERRENEITLLTKQQELERSEKERIAQSLLLEKEKNAVRENLERVRSLEQDARIQQQELDLKTEREKALTTQNRLLETQKKQEEERSQKARQIRNMAIVLGALMVLVALMILFGLLSTRKKNLILAEQKRQIEKINTDLEATNAEVISQKEIIEQKNQSITDSIQYASRIQAAVLPPHDFIDEWGLESFILFKPKDIVSGDFYWGVKKNDKIIIAAADCTGHGVPGAFMSMLGHAFLDEIINTRAIDNAAAILNLLRDEIINTLKQKGTTGEARDGMDISLVIIDMKNRKLDYAGANNALYIARKGKIYKYLPDHMPIGIHFITFTPFTNQVIETEEGDNIYLFSDGYADQFGGRRGKKFMYKPFQELLLKVSSQPMNIQKEMLDKTFEEWKHGYEQVDDVMVIGIKV